MKDFKALKALENIPFFILSSGRKKNRVSTLAKIRQTKQVTLLCALQECQARVAREVASRAEHLAE